MRSSNFIVTELIDHEVNIVLQFAPCGALAPVEYSTHQEGTILATAAQGWSMREFEEIVLHYYSGRRRRHVPWFALACLGAGILLLLMFLVH